MTKLVVILGFLIAFSAGLVIGFNGRRQSTPQVSPTTQPTRPDRIRPPGSFLAAHLNLTAEQRQAMDQIWSETVRGRHWKLEEKRRQCRKERDEAIAALLRASDTQKYESIMKTYAQGIAELEQEDRAAFQDAVAKTKKILNPEQLAKYEEFLKRHPGDRRDRDRDRDRGGDNRDRDNKDKDREHVRRAETRATTTRAATQQ